MLTDTSSGSPWLCGSYSDNNQNATSSLALYGWDILHTGSEINSNLSSEASSECSENLSSTLLSEVSSDCSDDLQLDLVSVMEEGIFGSIINAMNNSDSSDELETAIDNVSPKQSVKVKTSQDKTSPKSSLSQDLQSNIGKWQILSRNDQLSVIDDLSTVISKELGLREQLEIIRIINPTAQVSPTDREFIIDVESINEDKVRKIQEYLVFHASSCSLPEGENCCLTSQRKSSKVNKKQRSQEQKNQQRIVRQRQRKEYRQMMKERRSGLFAREEVLTVSEVIDPGDHEDIDVLG